MHFAYEFLKHRNTVSCLLALGLSILPEQHSIKPTHTSVTRLTIHPGAKRLQEWVDLVVFMSVYPLICLPHCKKYRNRRTKGDYPLTQP